MDVQAGAARRTDSKEKVYNHRDVLLMVLNLVHESVAAAATAEMTKFDQVVGLAVGGAHPVWKQ